jgi:hypothetical protein
MKTRPGRVGEHVEDIEFGQFLRFGIGVTLAKRMACGHGFTRIPGTKGVLLVPMPLPPGFDQVKWILSASRCHERGNIAESEGADNARVFGQFLKKSWFKLCSKNAMVGLGWMFREARIGVKWQLLFECPVNFAGRTTACVLPDQRATPRGLDFPPG